MAILAKQKILTLDYWKFASDLKVGDYVFDKEGKLQKIKVIQVYRAENCYRVTFTDNLTVSGDSHLGLQIEDKKYRDRVCEYKGKFKFRRPLKYKKISELAEVELKGKYKQHLFSIPTAKPLQLPHQPLPVEPFVFGFWFFNRNSSKLLHYTGCNNEFVTEKFKDAGYAVKLRKKHQTNGERCFEVSPSIASHLSFDSFHLIPNNYLLASPEQRLELLKGILHARPKSYKKDSNKFSFYDKSLALVFQMQALLESLGHRTAICKKKFTYQLEFRSKENLLPNQTPYTRPIVHSSRRYIRSIEQLPAQLCVHIETEGADNSILVGEGFIPVC